LILGGGYGAAIRNGRQDERDEKAQGSLSKGPQPRQDQATHWANRHPIETRHTLGSWQRVEGSPRAAGGDGRSIEGHRQFSRDVQPVLEAVAEQTNRLVGGFTTVVWRILEDVAYLAAFTPAADAALKVAAFRIPLSSWQIGETIRQGEVFSVADTERDVRSLREPSCRRRHGNSLKKSLIFQGKSRLYGG
jgi:hypothetical protein